MAISKVTSGGIADGTLTVEDIADDAVTAAKLANSINTEIAANTAKTGITSGQASTISNLVSSQAEYAYTRADLALNDAYNAQTTANAALPKAGGTMTGTIAGFTSTGIDDNATSTVITIDASENVGIGGSDTGFAATQLKTGSYSKAEAGLNILTTATGTGYLLFGDGAGAASYSGGIHYSHNTNNMHFRNLANNDRMVINSGGEVTMPNQPSFSAKSSGVAYVNTATGTWYQVPMNTTKHNNGSHYSTTTSRFTVPVSGVYSMHATVAWNAGISSSHAQLAIRVNGAGAGYQECDGIYQSVDTVKPYTRMYTSHVMSLNAADYLEVWVHQDSGASHNLRLCMVEFNGFLVG